MVAVSKLFEPPFCHYHCSQIIIHPGVSCFRNFIFNFQSDFVSSLKYFLPLLITPLVIKYKNLNWDLFLKTVKFYFEASSWTTLIGSSSFLFACCFRNILGSMRVYPSLFIPTTLGAQFCWFFSPRLLKLFTTASSHAALETILRRFPNKLTHLILYSSVVQTILFMFNSAIILHYKRKNIYRDFWFIQPYEKINKSTSTAKGQQTDVGKAYTNKKSVIAKCSHTNLTCTKFISDGIKSYIGFGILLDIVAMAMKNKVSKGNQHFFLQCLKRFKQFRPNMTVFFVSYVGLYRLSSCLLRKHYGHLSLDQQHIISAFMGGLSYFSVRRTNFLMLSIVIAIQLQWKKFCKGIKITEKDKKTNLALWLIKNAPLAQIIFSFNIGYLVHNYFLNSGTVNSLARRFVDASTSSRIKKYHNLLLQSDYKTLINMAENTPKITTFL